MNDITRPPPAITKFKYPRKKHSSSYFKRTHFYRRSVFASLHYAAAVKIFPVVVIQGNKKSENYSAQNLETERKTLNSRHPHCIEIHKTVDAAETIKRNNLDRSWFYNTRPLYFFLVQEFQIAPAEFHAQLFLFFPTLKQWKNNRGSFCDLLVAPFFSCFLLTWRGSHVQHVS